MEMFKLNYCWQNNVHWLESTCGKFNWLDMIWKGTHVCKVHSWQCMSEQKPSHEVKGIVRRAPRKDCVEAQIWGRIPKHFCSIEGPQEQWPPSFLKRKKFGTTKTLPRVNCLAKLSNQGRRALVREGTKNPMVTDRATEFLCGDGRTFQKDNHLRSTPPNQVEQPDGSHSLEKRNMTAHLDFV